MTERRDPPPPTAARRTIVETADLLHKPPRRAEAPARGAPPTASRARTFGKSAPLPVTARSIAATVIARVERDDAFAAAVLDAELRRAAQLDPRERAFATELVYGTLRLRLLLQKTLEAKAPRGIQALDPRVRAHLLVAAYQILFTRVPAFAAVSEAVNAVRALRGRTLAGFANGTLRSIGRDAEGKPQMPMALAVREATAPWLRRALERSIGDEATEAYLAAGPVPPPNSLRVRGSLRSASTARAEWIDKLRASGAFGEGATIQAGSASPIAIKVRGGGELRALPGFAEGGWTIQDEGSQVISMLVGARPGDRVLDACAGRGNKTLAMLDVASASSPSIEVHAADQHPDKLDRLGAELRRLGLPAVTTHAVDWSVGPGDVPLGHFDRVLVDAPCSGVGTLRRRPEIQSRRQALDLAELAALQTRIVDHAVATVKPGGRLFYAVCSVLRDETETVVRAVLDAHPELKLAPFDATGVDGAPLADPLFGPGATQGRLLTHLHGTDGYFIASFAKSA